MKLVRLTNANLITISRILFTPVVLFFFTLQYAAIHKIGFCLFIILCITDFLDGYCARVSNTESKLGTILDPLADKWLVLSSMILLVHQKELDGINIVVLYITLFREIFIMELRSLAREKNILIKSSKIAKLKTLFFMVGIGFMLLTMSFKFETKIYTTIGISLIWIAIVFSIISLIQYTKELTTRTR